jgi:hypothetical protein
MMQRVGVWEVFIVEVLERKKSCGPVEAVDQSS